MVSVPVMHTVHARKKRTRSHYNHSVYQLVDIDVPTLESEEAPVAMAFVDASKTVSTEIRYNDGRFWRPEMMDPRSS